MFRKAADIRKMLLGADADDEDDLQEGDRAENDRADNFFVEEAAIEEEGTTLTYIPDLGKDLLEKKRVAKETVFEAAKRKLDEMKKAKKAKKKELLRERELKETTPSTNEPTPSASTEVLELMFTGDEHDTLHEYDMRQIVKEAKKKTRKIKKKNSETSNQPMDNFEVDVDDSRFKGLFEGKNSHFGIDRTKPEYKETPGMKKILAAQQKRRNTGPPHLSRLSDDPQLQTTVDNPVISLVDSLKKKFRNKQRWLTMCGL